MRSQQCRLGQSSDSNRNSSGMPKPVHTVQNDDAAHPLTRFVAEMKRCGFNWVGDAFVPVSASARLADIKAFAQAMDLPHLSPNFALKIHQLADIAQFPF